MSTFLAPSGPWGPWRWPSLDGGSGTPCPAGQGASAADQPAWAGFGWLGLAGMAWVSAGFLGFRLDLA